MNLLLDEWITVRRRSGLTERIAPVRLTTRGDDPAVEIEAPRADFRGALYQFLIGVLQTALPPRDLRAWRERWETPPSEQELQEAFAPFAQAFELDSAGPAFMQDFELLTNAESEPLFNLLIDRGSDSNRYFSKQEEAGMCISCTATALFTLQINASGGGRGYQTSVRGGGPLTTLLVPNEDCTGLWHKIWMNVRPDSRIFPHCNGEERSDIKRIFPWLNPTLIGGKQGSPTTPAMASTLQCYWCMPRRIRLDFQTVKYGNCDVCGRPSEKLVANYYYIPRGTDYKGAWLHPLTPYKSSKGAEEPKPEDTPDGGVGYKYWLGLVAGGDGRKTNAATMVSSYFSNPRDFFSSACIVRLWCFGYHMPKQQAKARCWYDSLLPIHDVEPEQQVRFIEAIERSLDVAEEAASALDKYVKQAWFKRPKYRGNEPAVPQSFWQRSVTEFYRMLKRLADADLEREDLLIPLYRDWLLAVGRTAEELFDEWVLAAPIEDMNMARVVGARADLLRQLKTKGAAKRLWSAVNAFKEAKA